MDELAQLEPARQAVVLLPLAVVLLVSAWTDFKTRKVFNKVTYPSFFIGLACNGIALGWGGMLDGLGAAVLTLLVCLPLLAFKLVGAGDIKLLIVVGAFLGYTGLAQVTFYSILAGAAGGFALAAVNGYLWDMLKRMGRFLRGIYRSVAYNSAAFAEKIERDERSMIPFAIAILAGGVLTWTDAVYRWPELWDIFARVWSG